MPKLATSILLIIGIHIWLIKFLEVSFFNAKYNFEKKLCKEFTSIDQGNNSKIEEAITIDNNKNDDEGNSEEKNRQ